MSKELIMIGGTMGVGKTSTAKALSKLLPDNVMLDGDWCWDANPFVVTDETKTMVMDNICHVLNSFLRCSAYHNIIFCWVMHEQGIIDEIISRLDISDCRVRVFSLVCGEEQLRERMEADVKRGARTGDAIERSVIRLPLYASLDTEKLDVGEIDAREAARQIAARLDEGI